MMDSAVPGNARTSSSSQTSDERAHTLPQSYTCVWARIYLHTRIVLSCSCVRARSHLVVLGRVALARRVVVLTIGCRRFGLGLLCSAACSFLLALRQDDGLPLQILGLSRWGRGLGQLLRRKYLWPSKSVVDVFDIFSHTYMCLWSIRPGSYCEGGASGCGSS